jgi:hypothetical protein
MTEFSLTMPLGYDYDVYELLGDPTETFVAEAALTAGDNLEEEDPTTYEELELADVLLELINDHEVPIGEALERVAQSIAADQVLVWHDGSDWMICNTKVTHRRLKARYALNCLIKWAEQGTNAADWDLLSDGEEAIQRWDGHVGPPVVDDLAEALNLSREDAFRLITSDGGPYRNDPSGNYYLKARLAQRLIRFLRAARARHNPPES